MGRDLSKNKRLYVFIDETGDPGHPDDIGSSQTYQLNIISCDSLGVFSILKHISAFRYFKETGKELEKYHKDATKLCEIFRNCFRDNFVNFSSFYLTKGKYIGPYLKRSGATKYSYDPKRFRNYIIRMSLETLFQEIEKDGYPEIELVFDRYLYTEEDELNLKKYLRGNIRLPSFLHINQVDSLYCEPVQVADYLGKIIKDNHIDGLCKQTLDFTHCYCLEEPDNIKKEKCPAAP